MRFLESSLSMLMRRLDYFMAPFSEAAFQRYLTIPLGRLSMPVAAVLLLLGGIIGIAAPITWALERVYLQINGISAQASISNVDTYYVRKKPQSGPVVSVEWKKIRYTFRTRSGDTISSSIDREASNVRELLGVRSVEVIYAEKKPQLHLTRLSYGGFGHLAWLFLVGLAVGAHSALLLKRYWKWWQSEPAAPRRVLAA